MRASYFLRIRPRVGPLEDHSSPRGHTRRHLPLGPREGMDVSDRGRIGRAVREACDAAR